MGLPGSGKTTLAEELSRITEYPFYNADRVRSEYDDWDFSPEGRERQLQRMINLSDTALETNEGVICDFVCPFEEGRQKFNADVLIWMDTIEEGRFPDTNKIFEEPKKYDLRLKNFNYQIHNIVRVIYDKSKKDPLIEEGFRLAALHN